MSSNALEQISFTKARANLSEVFDGVIHQIRPVVISRKREKAVERDEEKNAQGEADCRCHFSFSPSAIRGCLPGGPVIPG